MKIETGNIEWNRGICERDNHPTKKLKTPHGHQMVLIKKALKKFSNFSWTFLLTLLAARYVVFFHTYIRPKQISSERPFDLKLSYLSKFYETHTQKSRSIFVIIFCAISSTLYIGPFLQAFKRTLVNFLLALYQFHHVNANSLSPFYRELSFFVGLFAVMSC